MRAGIAQVAARDHDVALIDLGRRTGPAQRIAQLRPAPPDCLCRHNGNGRRRLIVGAFGRRAGLSAQGATQDWLVRQLKQMAEGIPALSPGRAPDHGAFQENWSGRA